MSIEVTLRVTDIEKKAIAFCREKDVPYPIANYLVQFAEETTKELQEENAELKEDIEIIKADRNRRLERLSKGALEKTADLEKQLTEARGIIKIAREAYIKSGIYTFNSEPVYKEEVERLYALFFDKAEAFLKE